MVHPGDEERKQIPVAEVKPDSWGNKNADPSSKDDTVTLSKAQLRAFLEVIGQVGSLNISKDSNLTKTDSLENGTDNEIMPIYCSVGETQRNGSYATYSVGQASSQNHPCPLDTTATTSSSTKQWSPSSTVQESPTKLSPLSKCEQKRMQWAKEKAEMHDWNPWGKPGAGAPTQRPIASVAPRTDNQLLMVQSVPYLNSALNSYQSRLPSPSHFRSITSGNEMASNMQDSFYNKASYSVLPQSVKPVPPVFKSSIAFGQVENEESFSEAHLKKQQWLKELDMQREDQRLRKHAEQDRARLNSVPVADWLNGNKDDLESISVAGDGTTTIHYVPETQDRTHVRGQGFKLDPVSAAKAEERRQRAQEYQQAIRQQMEEKEKKKQEEKERKRREEEELECRLAEERAKMQKEYELEQKRLKEKEDADKNKEQVMISAIEEAKALAEAEKKIKKSNRQNPSNTNSEVFLDKPKSPEKMKTTEFMKVPHSEMKNFENNYLSEGDTKSIHQTATIHPVQSLKQDPDKISLSKELGIQTLQQSKNSTETDGYTVNRVLTPSFYRIKGRRGYRKDFGTQTDVNYGKWIDDDETTDNSCSSSISAPLVNRITRVQHSKPYKASRYHLGSDVESNSSRPKWGVNQPSKSFVRMTDRDPHFVKRKKLQELRKQHWEREMAVQQALRNARRSINASYPSLRSRRVKSSSEGTVGGFSSSELETSHSPLRRRSNLGYRSVCGSAEDVAYFRQSSTYTSTALPSVYRRRDSQSSDNLPSIVGGSEPPPSRLNKKITCVDMSVYNNLPSVRRKWHSQETFYPNVMGDLREMSPPVPSLQKRIITDLSSSSIMSPPVHNRRKWSDQESFDLESVAMSRAKSHPSLSDEGSDRHDRDSLSSAASSEKIKMPINHNPLVHPEVVTGRPTPRQDRILQNLSSLRKGLMQKQRELENFIRNPPAV